MILTLKGYRYIAAVVSMVEVVIYVVGLGLVLDNLNEIQNLIAYAVGYGCGVIIGTKIEEKLALGYVTVNVIITPRIKKTSYFCSKKEHINKTNHHPNHRQRQRAVRQRVQAV